jgi:glycine cleavage system H lipoate-binding protein/ABC-type phosphate transport system substrate-binding protein
MCNLKNIAMKKTIVLISILVSFVLFSTNINAKPSLHSSNVEDSIYVWTSPDLFDIATTWVSAYESINPEAKIRVSNIPDNMVNDMLNKSGNIGLITKNYIPATHKTNWQMAVGRDIIVPVMSSENPLLDEIIRQGISQEEFASFFSNTKESNWGSLLNKKQSNPVNCYCINNESTKLHLAEFLQTDVQSLTGKDIDGIETLLSKIRNDKYALGYCKLAEILNYEDHDFKKGISVIPIDINGNNKIDHFENIYKNANELERGVWIGKYPKVLFSNIFSVAADQPIKSNEVAFLEWILTDGQQYLSSNSYSELLSSEKQNNLQILYDTPMPIAEVQSFANTRTSTIIILLLIAGAVLTLLVLMYRKSRKPKFIENVIVSSEAFNESSIKAPTGIFFDKTHTWAFMEKDGFVRIGVADFLQHVTGKITNVKMRTSGETVKKGEPFLSLIQNGKQLEIYSPVSGKIKEINSNLNFKSNLVNLSPYSDGWIYKIESDNWLTEIKTFLMGDSYKKWIKNEFTRLKDFFSRAINSPTTANLQIVMQDGGEISDNPMESFGPKVWEDFQAEFINKAK